MYPNGNRKNNALHLQEVGNLDYAIDCYETALSIDVHYAKAALQLGVLYRQKGGPHDLVLAQVHLLLLTNYPNKTNRTCNNINIYTYYV